ncbi:ABC transporter ATP-binding protein [Ornithinibacillus halotolerans]|uniref:ABC transporter ATP-binding protein n=1 Tax=Ornithinibacillus halotolerans TaxID=1274357 RepID=A0A916WEL4_9BACI|nr:ABC transporter ATP-binding protein [Ornithinibacillus halotolerans]GGA91190.1 ABC transporter ATP-binding protein [Ornithinibacillus halotolerans]
MSDETLVVKDLTVSFSTENGKLTAVSNATFSINQGETVCIVGESGSGKSVTSLSIMGLLPKQISTVETGEILLNGENLLEKSSKEMRNIRGQEMAMIFQEPMTSLNPVYTIGDQVSEGLRYHRKMSKKEALKYAVKALEKVGIPSPQQRIHEYPHQLSGGMRQRVMIAMALSCNPRLLIADEPTTALDVTIQAQVLEVMKELKKDTNMSILFITHDLGVVADVADRVVVMYAGAVVEEADVWQIFEEPLHPYTLGLLEAMPSVDGAIERMKTIEGTIPNATNLPKGCRFHPRCPFATDLCKETEPTLEIIDESRKVACWNYKELKKKEVI